ncbi:MAG: ABC transporter permease [Bacteroidetes bacterium]|nr:ABC transporter permease [Bacteroidota bacterium]
MFKSYFKTAFRNLIRNRMFTVLNILVLSTGLAATILILLWVSNELSYDRWNVNADRTYRIIATTFNQAYPLSGAPLGLAVKAQIPGVKYFARLKGADGKQSIFMVGQRRFEEKRAFFADPELLKVFSFPLVSGETLGRPDGVLLTESTARRFFGSEAAIGKTIGMDSNTFVVTGVLREDERSFCRLAGGHGTGEPGDE